MVSSLSWRCIAATWQLTQLPHEWNEKQETGGQKDEAADEQQEIPAEQARNDEQEGTQNKQEPSP